MKFNNLLTITILAIFATTLSLNAYAEDKKTALPINVPPQLLAAEKSYQEKIAKLPEDVQKEFEEYDNYLLQLQKPEIESILSDPTFKFCREKGLHAQKEYAKMIASYKLKRDYMNARNMESFKPPENLLKHIEKDRLIEHALFRRLERRQAFSHTAKHFLSTLESPDQISQVCEKNNQNLENDFKNPYFVETNLKQRGFSKLEREKSQSCSIGYRYLTPEKELVSLAIIFFESEGEHFFEMSSKVITEENKKGLNVQNAWLHFGSLNTFSMAKKAKPYDSLLILQLPEKAAPPILAYIKDKPTFIGTYVKSWTEPVIFSAVLEESEVNKMANCVASIAPELSDKISSAGFQTAN